MAKEKKSGKKAVKRKPNAKANKTPMLENPHIIDLRTPHSTESSGNIATRFLGLVALIVAWVTSVRKHFVGGGKLGDVPVFNPKNFVEINKARQTQKEYDEDVDRHNDGERVDFYPRYNPVVVDLANSKNVQTVTLRRGVLAKHSEPPKDWDEKLWGSWYLQDEDGEYTIPSGWFFDKIPPRRCHASTAEKLVEDADKNILTFGNNRYVVGDGTAVRCGPMLVWATQRGNYRAGDSARKRMSIAGNKDVVDVVYRIEDRANNGGGVTVKANWGDVKEVVFLPGQALTAGFLFDAKGDRLTAKAIRGLDGDTKGLKFKTVRQVLDGPIVGKPITKDRLWDEIQAIEGNKGVKKLRDREGRSEYEVDTTPRNKSMTNLHTTTRVSPVEGTPFAFRAAQCDTVPYTIQGAEKGEFSMGIVIGDRSNYEHNVGVQEAKVEEVETTVEEVPEVSKADQIKAEKAKQARAAKAEKAKFEKAAKAAKAKAAKAAKVEKPADAAPPVEHDTADEPAVESEAVATE